MLANDLACQSGVSAEKNRKCCSIAIGCNADLRYDKGNFAFDTISKRKALNPRLTEKGKAMTLRVSMIGWVLAAMLATSGVKASGTSTFGTPNLRVVSIHLDSGLPKESELDREVLALMPIGAKLALADIQKLADSIGSLYEKHGIQPAFVYIDGYYVSRSAIELRVRVLPNRQKRSAVEFHIRTVRPIDGPPVHRGIGNNGTRIDLHGDWAAGRRT